MPHCIDRPKDTREIFRNQGCPSLAKQVIIRNAEKRGDKWHKKCGYPEFPHQKEKKQIQEEENREGIAICSEVIPDIPRQLPVDPVEPEQFRDDKTEGGQNQRKDAGPGYESVYLLYGFIRHGYFSSIQDLICATSRSRSFLSTCALAW